MKDHCKQLCKQRSGKNVLAMDSCDAMSMLRSQTPWAIAQVMLRNSSSSLKSFRKSISFVVMLVMTMLGLMPRGYMVEAADGNGLLLVRICAEAGAERYVAWDSETGQFKTPGDLESDKSDEHETDDMAEGVCAFSAQTPLTTASPWSFTAIERIAIVSTPALPRAPPFTSTLSDRFAARAPPHFS